MFRIKGDDEAREVAVRFALTCRPKPQHLDFVMFPSELADDLGLNIPYAPREDLEPFLRARHHEIVGLTSENSPRLAAAILACIGRRVERVREHDLPSLGMELCRRDAILRAFLRGQWPTLLGGLSPTGE